MPSPSAQFYMVGPSSDKNTKLDRIFNNYAKQHMTHVIDVEALIPHAWWIHRKGGGHYHFIVKGDSGSQVFHSFRHLYAALGRSALHVAALRGTGHPLALTAPHS